MGTLLQNVGRLPPSHLPPCPCFARVARQHHTTPQRASLPAPTSSFGVSSLLNRYAEYVDKHDKAAKELSRLLERVRNSAVTRSLQRANKHTVACWFVSSCPAVRTKKLPTWSPLHVSRAEAKRCNPCSSCLYNVCRGMFVGLTQRTSALRCLSDCCCCSLHMFLLVAMSYCLVS